jgi:hypothetical protein
MTYFTILSLNFPGRKEENLERISVDIVGVSVEIRVGRLQNTSQMSCRLTRIARELCKLAILLG